METRDTLHLYNTVVVTFSPVTFVPRTNVKDYENEKEQGSLCGLRVYRRPSCIPCSPISLRPIHPLSARRSDSQKIPLANTSCLSPFGKRLSNSSPRREKRGEGQLDRLQTLETQIANGIERSIECPTQTHSSYYTCFGACAFYRH